MEKDGIMAATDLESATASLISNVDIISDVINEDATTEVVTPSGNIPSIRKALADNAYFQDPISWSNGDNETNFNQLRTFTDGTVWWSPSATNINPVPMGVTPVGDSNWYPWQDRNLKNNILEEVTRFKIKGTFAAGFTYDTVDDVGLDNSGNPWTYTGSLPFTVVAGTVPSAPTYNEENFSDHNSHTNINAVGAHDEIYVRSFDTVSDLKMGRDSSGQIIDMSTIVGNTVSWKDYYEEGDGHGNTGVVKTGVHTEDGGRILSINISTYVEAIPTSVNQFGVIEDSANDYTDNIIKALNSELDLVMRGGTYLLTSPIEIKSNLSNAGKPIFFDVSFSTIEDVAVSCEREVDIGKVVIDCQNTATITAGFQHTLEFTPTRKITSDVTSMNVTNTDNTLPAYGCLYFVGSGASNNSIHIEILGDARVITATPNGIIGDSAGKATGILVSVNKAGMENNCKLIRNSCSTIYPSEDGDGIHIFDVDSSNTASKSIYEIDSPVLRDCSKRGIKSQAPNCKTFNPFIDIDLNDGLATSQNAYQSLAVNNTLTNPHVVGTNSVNKSDGSILVSNSNFTLENPYIKVAAGQNLLRFETLATDYSVTGGSIEVTEAYSSPDFTMVLLEGDSSGSLDLKKVVNTTGTGSVIRYSNCSGSHRIKIKNGRGEHLIRWSFCTGDFIVDDAISADGLSGTIFRQEGDSGNYTIKHAIADTTGDNVCTAAAPVKFIGEGVLSSSTNGILYTGAVNLTGRKVVGNWSLSSSAGTGKGIDALSSRDGDFTGCETTGYSEHIDVSFSNGCRVSNNLGRGTGIHVDSTSATNLVDFGNNIIP